MKYVYAILFLLFLTGAAFAEPGPFSGSATSSCPTAGASTKGCVKIGSNLAISSTGVLSATSSGSSAFSALTAATTTNSINNGSNAQTWAFNGLTTQTALSLTSTSLSTGKLLDVEQTGGINSTGYGGYFSMVTTGAGYGLYALTTGGANTGYAGYFQNPSTTGFAVYSNGNTYLSSTTTIAGALNATATAKIGGNLTVVGSTSLANTTTVSNLTITGTCIGCGSGAAFTPVLQPLSVTTTDAGNIFPYTYFDSTTTGASAMGSPSWGVAASLSADALLRFRFKMPPTLPATGTLNLCTLCQANATTGNVKYTVMDSACAVNNTCSPGATALTSETQTSITWSAVDNYVETCTPLTNTPAANGVSIGAIKFQTSSWTLAQILSCNMTESWR